MIDNAKLRIPAFRHLSVLDFAATDGKNLGTAFFVVSCYNSEWELTQVKNRGEKKDSQVYTTSRRGLAVCCLAGHRKSHWRFAASGSDRNLDYDINLCY